MSTNAITEFNLRAAVLALPGAERLTSPEVDVAVGLAAGALAACASREDVDRALAAAVERVVRRNMPILVEGDRGPPPFRPSSVGHPARDRPAPGDELYVRLEALGLKLAEVEEAWEALVGACVSPRTRSVEAHDRVCRLENRIGKLKAAIEANLAKL